MKLIAFVILAGAQCAIAQAPKAAADNCTPPPSSLAPTLPAFPLNHRCKLSG